MRREIFPRELHRQRRLSVYAANQLAREPLTPVGLLSGLAGRATTSA